MAQFIGGEVPLNGTAWVSVVGSPGAAHQRQIISVKVKNRDTVNHTVKGRKVTASGNFESSPLTLAPDQEEELLRGYTVLDATSESYEVQSDAVATTIEPLVDVAVFEVP